MERLSNSQRGSNSPRSKSALAEESKGSANTLRISSLSRKSASPTTGRTSSDLLPYGRVTCAATSKRVEAISEEAEQRGLATICLSGRALKAFPEKLFTRDNIGDLDLSSNSIRSLPTEIEKITSLVVLDLSRNSLRCSDREDSSGLPLSLGSLVNLEALILCDCNLPFTPPAIWKCRNLRVLDIGGNKIKTLPAEIGNLEQLEHLNVQRTGIRTLPEEIALCQELQELVLWGNAIETLPDTMKELWKLKTLAINYRKFSARLDEHAIDLLQKGQMKSLHLPRVIFEMPAQEVLDLASSVLNSLPDRIMPKLREFYLSNNYFQAFPRAILTLVELQTLDLSHNGLISIPQELGQCLKQLKVLILSQNKIWNLPTSIYELTNLVELDISSNQIKVLTPNVERLSSLRKLFLQNNRLTELPGSLGNLESLDTLDVSRNQIASLPVLFHRLRRSMPMAHGYRNLRRHGLWLIKNPLKVPPPSVWETNDTTEIFDYLLNLEISQKAKEVPKRKLIVLGESMSGKTTLVRRLKWQKCGDIRNGEDVSKGSTKFVDISTWLTSNSVEFLVYDFGGDTAYDPIRRLHLDDDNAIYLIVYDHRKYNEQGHHRAIGYWLETLAVHVPGAVVKIVGTQCDLCNQDFISKTTDLVRRQIDWQQLRQRERLDEELERAGSGLKSGELEEFEKVQIVDFVKTAEFSKSHQIRILGDISPVSCDEEKMGISELVKELEALAINVDLFPFPSKDNLDIYLKLCTALKEKKSLFIELEEIISTARDFDIAAENITEFLSCSRDLGRLMWFKTGPNPNQIITVPNPTLLGKLLSEVFNPMILHQDFVFEKNPLFSSQGGFTAETFEIEKKNFQGRGQLSRSFLHCLLFYMEMDQSMLNDFLRLMTAYRICYVASTSNSSPQLVVLPWFTKESLSPADDLNLDSRSEKEEEVRSSKITISLRFPLFYPEMVFESLTCFLHDRLEVGSSGQDWQDLVHLESGENGNFLAIVLKRQLEPPSYDCKITIEIRGVDESRVTEMAREAYAEFMTIVATMKGLAWYAEITHEGFEMEPNLL